MKKLKPVKYNLQSMHILLEFQSITKAWNIKSKSDQVNVQQTCQAFYSLKTADLCSFSLHMLSVKKAGKSHYATKLPYLKCCS